MARRWTQTSPEAPATSPMPLCEHNISTIRIPGPPVAQSFAPHEKRAAPLYKPPPCLGNTLAKATPWRASPYARDVQRPLSVVAPWVGCTDACTARCPPAVRRKLMRGYACVHVYIYVWCLGLINLHELVRSIPPRSRYPPQKKCRRGGTYSAIR